MSIVHTEVIELEARPDQVRAFIMTPDRILDYYPDPVEGGVFEPGSSIWCRGKMGVSVLERIEDECSDDVVVIKVTTAIGLGAPYTRENIEQAATFTMIEDWALAPSGSGTTLTKTWRDVVANGEPPFPLEEGVRHGARHESKPLIESWNRAARESAR